MSIESIEKNKQDPPKNIIEKDDSLDSALIDKEDLSRKTYKYIRKRNIKGLKEIEEKLRKKGREEAADNIKNKIKELKKLDK